MKSRVALMCLGLATAGFCVDEYQPIAPNTLELDGGVNPVFPDLGNNYFGLPLQAKYGIMPGLDVELATNLVVAGNATGLTQPDIAAKYAIQNTGLAVYLDLVLPFAAGDFGDGYTGLGIAPGVVYGKNFGKIQAVAKASYQINLESDNYTPGSVLDVFLKPGYTVDDKLAGYVGLDFKMTGKPDPSLAGPDGNTITLLPGATYTLSPTLSLEANIPIVFSNDVGPTSWGVWASVYYTMPL